MSRDRDEAPPPEQTEGYLVVLTPAGMRRHLGDPKLPRGEDPVEYGRLVTQWHADLGRDDLWSYRGVGRNVVGRSTEWGEQQRGEYRDAMAAFGEDLNRLATAPSDLDPARRAELAALFASTRSAHAAEGREFEDVAAWARWMAAQAFGLPAIPWPTEAEVAELADMRASRLMLARLPELPEAWWNCGIDTDLIPDLSLAREILAACDTPSDRELIYVRRAAPSRSRGSLGFDVAQWGGSHVSLIRDCLVAPQWAPPPQANVPGLRAHVARLNRHVLFDHPADAVAFRTWYLGHEWAEPTDDPDEFPVIEVSIPAP